MEVNCQERVDATVKSGLTGYDGKDYFSTNSTNCWLFFWYNNQCLQMVNLFWLRVLRAEYAWICQILVTSTKLISIPPLPNQQWFCYHLLFSLSLCLCLDRNFGHPISIWITPGVTNPLARRWVIMASNGPCLHSQPWRAAVQTWHAGSRPCSS